MESECGHIISNESLVSMIVVGVGQRGIAYAQYAHDFPNRLSLIGVAEPRKYQRENLQILYNIPEDNVFTCWSEVVQRERFADCVVVATPDRLHKDAAVAFARLGYHILLEKPMAVTVADCEEIVTVCRHHAVILAVCHVLRYTPQAQTVRRLIESGAIGTVVNIQMLEPVGFWHFAHSFVRGNWHREEASTFSLLAKCCHDFDLLLYWMGNNKVQCVSSFGSLRHFTRDNKPDGAAERCLDCAVSATCPYSANKIYLDHVKMGHTGWPVSVITDVPDIESVTDALRTGPYGKCVYDCDNDVCDNQVVNLQFEDGATVNFTMVAFTQDVCDRKVKIFGTKGELQFSLSSPIIKHYDFTIENCKTHVAKVSEDFSKSTLKGHGGADFYAMNAFIEAVMTGDSSKVLTGPEDTLRSHRLVFAAEESRRNNLVIRFES